MLQASMVPIPTNSSEQSPLSTGASIVKSIGNATWKLFWGSIRTPLGTLTELKKYGQTSPATVVEAWLTALSFTSGAMMFAVCVGIITSQLISLDAVSSQYQQKIDVINQYMAHQRLPEELRERIRENYKYRWRTRRIFNEDELLNELPGPLRIDVTLHMAQQLVQQVPFFDGADQGFIISIVNRLYPQVYIEGDLIIRQGDISREMYFIRYGQVNVLAGGKVVTVLADGSFFGEVGLMKKTRRTATVQALTNCDLFMLTKAAFDEVLDDYPTQRVIMDEIIEHRMEQHRKSRAYQEQQQAKSSGAVDPLANGEGGGGNGKDQDKGDQASQESQRSCRSVPVQEVSRSLRQIPDNPREEQGDRSGSTALRQSKTALDVATPQWASPPAAMRNVVSFRLPGQHADWSSDDKEQPVQQIPQGLLPTPVQVAYTLPSAVPDAAQSSSASAEGAVGGTKGGNEPPRIDARMQVNRSSIKLEPIVFRSPSFNVSANRTLVSPRVSDVGSDANVQSGEPD